MTIAPFVTEEDEQYMYFSQTRALFDRLRPMLYPLFRSLFCPWE